MVTAILLTLIAVALAVVHPVLAPWILPAPTDDGGGIPFVLLEPLLLALVLVLPAVRLAGPLSDFLPRKLSALTAIAPGASAVCYCFLLLSHGPTPLSAAYPVFFIPAAIVANRFLHAPAQDRAAQWVGATLLLWPPLVGLALLRYPLPPPTVTAHLHLFYLTLTITLIVAAILGALVARLLPRSAADALPSGPPRSPNPPYPAPNGPPPLDYDDGPRGHLPEPYRDRSIVPRRDAPQNYYDDDDGSYLVTHGSRHDCASAVQADTELIHTREVKLLPDGTKVVTETKRHHKTHESKLVSKYKGNDRA